MIIDNTLLLHLATALGIGLLIGAERERNKGSGAERSSAGIRTFTIAALLGAVSSIFDFWLLVVSILCVMIFVAIAYFSRQNDDPGLTTEIALVFTVILGGLAISSPALAAGLAVAVAILLAAKEPMHGFVSKAITKAELNDFLVLAAATLIILPLVPNQFLGPFAAINPRNLWLIVILIMSVGALGHFALRVLGGHIGLPIAGFLSGFISSIATIGSMGERAKAAPDLISATAAGAVLSSLATILQLAMLLAAVHPPTLQALLWPLVFSGVSIAVCGLFMTLNAYQKNHASTPKPKQMFSVKTTLIITAVIASMLVISAALKTWFGEAGLIAAAGVAGLVDVHAAAISVASLAGADKLGPESAVIPILVALSINAVSKAVMAVMSGGKNFAQQVIPAMFIQIAAAWLGWWL